jgi:hypothetical protein
MPVAAFSRMQFSWFPKSISGGTIISHSIYRNAPELSPHSAIFGCCLARYLGTQGTVQYLNGLVLYGIVQVFVCDKDWLTAISFHSISHFHSNPVVSCPVLSCPCPFHSVFACASAGRNKEEMPCLGKFLRDTLPHNFGKFRRMTI